MTEVVRLVKNRSREEIMAEILKHSLDGEKKTKLVFRTHTSFTHLTIYLDLLLRNGLLEILPETKLYRTTEKGKMFLQNYEALWQKVVSAKESADTAATTRSIFP